jgi:hypothetical protein
MCPSTFFTHMGVLTIVSSFTFAFIVVKNKLVHLINKLDNNSVVILIKVDKFDYKDIIQIHMGVLTIVSSFTFAFIVVKTVAV